MPPKKTPSQTSRSKHSGSIHEADADESPDHMAITLVAKSNQLRATTETACIIRKFATNLKKTNSSKINKGFLDARHELNQNYWEGFREEYGQLLLLITDDEQKTLPIFINDEYARVEEAYLDADAFIKQKCHELFPVVSTSNAASSPNHRNHEVPQISVPTSKLKLPPITIPKFNGDYMQWPSFYDLFTSLVHNNDSISPVQKLHYLKSNLVGEPEKVIKNVQITALNYDPAWEQLVQRYDNKRVLVNSRLKSIFEQPRMNVDTATGIKQLLDTTTESLNSLQNLGVDTSTWDCLIVYILVHRLTNESHQLWEQSLKNSRELPTFDEFKEFLEARYRTLEALSENKPKQSTMPATINRPTSNRPTSNRKHAYHTAATASSSSCPLCKGTHSIRSCNEFKQKLPVARFETAKQKNLCINCLSSGHSAARCPSKHRCFDCQKRHHTLLHTGKTDNRAAEVQSATTNNDDSTLPVSSNLNAFHTTDMKTHNVLLATALVSIITPAGNELIVRALLDQASEGSFITEATARRLQLKLDPTDTIVSGIGDGLTTSTFSTSFAINAHFQTKINLNINAYVLKSLTGTIPSTKLFSRSWNHTSELQLADPSFHTPGKIDLLLGVDVYNAILMDGIRRGPIGTPLAQKTRLGWILSGCAPNETVERNSSSHITIISRVSLLSIDAQLRKFWEIEELPSQHTPTQEEQQCEKIFYDNYKRTTTGRFVVKLPFIDNFGTENVLGRSRSIAVSRLHQLEHRFQKNSKFYLDYSKCLQEYLDLSHMDIASTTESELTTFSKLHSIDVVNGCYIPHHAVIKESSTTTQTRVVFDASRRTMSGKSLNECLLNGPTLQDDIASITLRWRKHQYVVTADVEKMYRQIQVTEEDANYQRIVWRWKGDEPIQEYRLRTLTFGTKPAAYLAIKCIQTLAEAERKHSTLAADTILHDFYVDDMLSGADTIEDAIKMRKEVSEALQKGGFELRKWASNHPLVIKDVPKLHCETKLLLNFEQEDSIKTLGLYWHPSSDQFQFKLTLKPLSNIISKRTILSDIAKLYDPNGWLSPVTVRAKIIMQSLWLTGVNWDDSISTKIVETWTEFRSNLWALEDIRIPRWVDIESHQQHVELHCFTDASTHAYAAAIYIRIKNEAQQVSCKLLTAKTKVAPIQQISLPRLELCAVTLGAKIINQVVDAMKLNFTQVYGWTDSTIVLAWLKAHPNKWKTFIANRVSEIHRTSKSTIWRHVPTKDNPADVASRGIGPQDLQQHPLWWSGPAWLVRTPDEWPTLNALPETQVEERQIKSFVVDIQTAKGYPSFEKFSTYTRLIRCTAYVFRFVHKARRISTENTYLTSNELNDALSYCIKKIQLEVFSSQIKTLLANECLQSRDKLLSLNPIIDSQGVLRVGGRLEHTHLSYDARHPILLPSNHHFTRILIENYHRSSLHGGSQIISSLMRQRYWLINARSTIRNIISKCVTCRRHQATIRTQLMGQLPSIRANLSRPFQHTGVDYAGPFDVKLQRGRCSKYSKAYICLFVCMAVKAVHLELVSDLTTAGFLAAFRRFTARRGLCSTITSDNGTNFVGAARVIKQDFKQVKIESELAEILANDGVEWRFIPPAAPNFGGLWEAGVKSTKFHLKRTLGNSNLTFEEFSTVLIQIEGVLNSRPLCPLSTDPSALEVLTPGHFLIGGAIIAPPQPNLMDINTHRLDRWQRTQQIYQAFWKKWSTEYITLQQQRPKWARSQTNLQIDDMVLVKDERMTPTKWLLGRIVATHPGKDGMVRVVTIRTKNGETLKSVSKLCVLPN